MVARDDIKSVLINGLRYPLDAPVERSQLGIFARKFIVGDAQFDSDDYLSALILSNLSGGIGIEDSDEGADTTRFWFGIMDTRSPRMIGLPPLVHEPTSPQAGAARPIGVVGTQFYMAFDDDVYGWDDDSDDWHSTANAIVEPPVGKSVAFDGRVFIPQGSSGHTFVTEATAATGTLTDAQEATPEAVAFAIWNNTLYALASDGDLWSLAVGDDPATDWAQVQNSLGTTLKLNTSEEPQNLVTYFNRAGEPTLWAITDRAAYQYYEPTVEWRQSNIVFPPHPDFGRSACVWRTGEDLWITAGMDVVRQTTGNAIVPLGSGLSRDQGVPQEYRGTIVDLEPEISHLYALVGNGSTPTQAFTYAASVGSAGSGNGEFDNVWGVAVDASGNVWAGDLNNERVQVFNSSLAYQAQFGSVGTGNGEFASNNGPYDLAFDGSGDLFVVDRGNHRVQKFDVTGTAAVYTSQFGASGTGNGQFSSPEGIAIKTSSGRIYVADTGNHRIQYFTSSGTYEGQWGSNGTGSAQFSTPVRCEVNQTTGDVYVLNLGTGTVKQFTATGTFIREWGGLLTHDGDFTATAAIAIHPATGNVVVADSGRDDIQEFTPTGTRIRSIGSSGTGNGQFRNCNGVAFNAAGTALVASDATNEDIQSFTYDVGATLPAYPTLHAWPGTGWHGLWEGDDNTTLPTWMHVSAADDHYWLWWGDEAGQAYHLKLFRGFENPNQARLSGGAEFAEEGFLLSSKFDAGMLGFRKSASHVRVIPIEDSITANEKFVIEFSIDDGGWETLGTVNATTLANTSSVTLSFGDAGRAFDTIRFRVSGDRGSTTSLSPFLRSLTFLFRKIPQNARSLVFTIAPSAADEGSFGNRTGQVMFQELDDLADTENFFDVSYNGLTFEHCCFAGSTGHDNISNNSGKRVVSIIQIPLEAA